jgi:hypothetical protein
LRKKFVGGEWKIVALYYCKQRWCLGCSRIRSAHAINIYKPKIEQLFTEPYFVTLTARTVSGSQLKGRVDRMIEVFRMILKSSYKKFYDDASWGKLSGIRSLEVTYNTAMDKYHAHFHLVVDSKVAAEFIVAQWLKRWKGKVVKKAQDVRVADAGSYIELFKYVTKLTDKDSAISAEALDVIYRSICAKRLLQPFGCMMAFVPEKLDDDDFDKELEAQSCKDVPGWLWEYIKYDWIEVRSGADLTSYEPSAKERALWGAAEDCVLFGGS